MEIQIEDTPWNVFDKKFYVDNSTTQYEYVEYKERNVRVDTLSDYTLVNQDLDVALRPSDSFIKVTLEIINASTGNAITSGKIALNNNGFNLFRTAQYSINDQIVEELNEPGVATLVKGLIDYSKAYGKGLTNEFWYPDFGAANNTSLKTSATDSVFDKYHTMYAVGAGGTVYKVDVVNGSTIHLVVISGVAADENVSFYLDGYRVYVQRYGGTGTQTVATDVICTVAAANGRVAITGAARYSYYELIREDGAEVQIFSNGIIAKWVSVGGAPALITTAGDAAVADGQTLTFRCIDLTNSFTNKGFMKRRLRTIENTNEIACSKPITLFLPVKRLFKIFHFNDHIFRGVKHTIKLYKNFNRKTLFMRDFNSVEADIKIKDISWWIPALRPSIDFGLKLDKDLNSGAKTKLEWEQVTCVASTEFDAGIGTGSQATWRITSTGNKPVKVYIVFRTSPRYIGNQTGPNAMVFDHMNIKTIQLRINSLQFPKEEYSVDFVTADSYSRLYMQYLQMTGNIYDFESGGPSLSYEDFKNIYPIFCFDLRKQDPQIWANVTQADMEIRFTRSLYTSAPFDTATFTIYAIIEYERYIQLSGTNNRMVAIF